MKLLLTSTGISNQTIANALVTLVGKETSQIKVAVIPTAANVELGNKSWLIEENLVSLQKYGIEWIDIVDISAEGVAWKNRLADVDVVLVGGGNTFHLLNQVRKTDFDKWLYANLDTKVYVGVSVGATLVTPSMGITSLHSEDIDYIGLDDLTGLGFVDFEISVHTPESVSHEANREYLKTINNDLYALDNKSAIVVDGDHTEVVSEGEWVKY